MEVAKLPSGQTLNIKLSSCTGKSNLLIRNDGTAITGIFKLIPLTLGILGMCSTPASLKYEYNPSKVANVMAYGPEGLISRSLGHSCCEPTPSKSLYRHPSLLFTPLLSYILSASMVSG